MLKFVRLKIYFSIIEDLILPTFKGSTFRGMFKTALKRSCCHHHGQKCEQCSDQFHCPYPVLTENRTETGMSTVLPYIINSHDLVNRYYQQGRIISFELLLLGSAIDFIPYIIDSLTQWHKLSVSKFKFMVSNDEHLLINNSTTWPKSILPRGRISLEKVEQILPDRIIVIYSPGKTLKLYKPQHLSEVIQQPYAGNWRVRLQFITPTRFLRKGLNLKKFYQGEKAPLTPISLQFGIIYQSLHDRYRDLCNFYGRGFMEGDFPEKQKIMLSTTQVGIIQSSLSMEKIKRVNPSSLYRVEKAGSKDKGNRTGMKWHHHDGFTGTIDYDNVPGFMLPMIKAGELFNVGKSTAMGYGKYTATFLSA